MPIISIAEMSLRVDTTVSDCCRSCNSNNRGQCQADTVEDFGPNRDRLSVAGRCPIKVQLEAQPEES